MEAASPSILYTVFQFLLLLSILVFVHEWGHYIVARMFGVKIETFSIGFGREIFGWTDKNETRWKISMLPLGGFVKFYGDASAASNPAKMLSKIPEKERDRCFHYKPLWQRFLIVFAGPAINVIFAVVLFTGLLFTYGANYFAPVIGGVSENMPGAEAGLKVGDRILEVNGEELVRFYDFAATSAMSPGEPMEFVIDRQGEILTFIIAPKLGTSSDGLGNEMEIGLIGIRPDPNHFVTEDLSFPQALVAGTKRTYRAFGIMVDTIGRLLTGKLSIKELGGPVKIAQYTGQSASQGIPTFIAFMALISINLGLVNLLPIPLLDGGHLLFYSIEAAKGSPVSVKAQEMASMIGLAFVLGLLFVLTWNDIGLPGLS